MSQLLEEEPERKARADRGGPGVGAAMWVVLATVVLALAVIALTHISNKDDCIVLVVGGNTLCGDSAKAWCDATDEDRPYNDSQIACDEIRGINGWAKQGTSPEDEAARLKEAERIARGR